MRRRFAVVVVGAFGAGLVGACGGGGAGPADAPAAPAAAIDPSSDGSVTGPVNRARAVAEAQEERDAQLEQPGDGQP